jgi:hypothetical protein
VSRWSARRSHSDESWDWQGANIKRSQAFILTVFCLSRIRARDQAWIKSPCLFVCVKARGLSRRFNRQTRSKDTSFESLLEPD